MSLIKSNEYREEQRNRLKGRIDQLVDNAIEHPDYSAGILPIDDLDEVITKGSFSRICIREKSLIYQVKQLENDLERLKIRYDKLLKSE